MFRRQFTLRRLLAVILTSTCCLTEWIGSPISESKSDEVPSPPKGGGAATAAPAPRFTLPEGFVIEQVAAAPLVRYPLFGCFDDAGRLYVAEGTGQSVPGAELIKQPLGRITRLEDTDGDGKFDTSVPFAEGLVFPQGVLWHEGVVYVASHPAIWRLEDTDGDGRADRREEFVARFNFNGNGCDIHGPFLGPDGRLYWTDGRHGYNIERPDGTRLEGFASRLWRCRTDGRELERVAGGGFDNPVEIAWTPEGELLGTMDQGAGDCLLHYVEGGVYPEDHPCVREFPRTGPLLPVVRRYSVELPAALCGTMCYRSDRFGPDFQDTLITTHYMTHKLVRSTLIRDGSTFRAEDADFLVSSDPHLRLTD
ncbi:MAG: PVC-type heme-binding CxxCH protein, partial [Planctomycetales bacterium]